MIGDSLNYDSYTPRKRKATEASTLSDAETKTTPESSSVPEDDDRFQMNKKSDVKKQSLPI